MKSVLIHMNADSSLCTYCHRSTSELSWQDVDYSNLNWYEMDYIDIWNYYYTVHLFLINVSPSHDSLEKVIQITDVIYTGKATIRTQNNYDTRLKKNELLQLISWKLPIKTLCSGREKWSPIYFYHPSCSHYFHTGIVYIQI